MSFQHNQNCFVNIPNPRSFVESNGIFLSVVDNPPFDMCVKAMISNNFGCECSGNTWPLDQRYELIRDDVLRQKVRGYMNDLCLVG